MRISLSALLIILVIWCPTLGAGDETQAIVTKAVQAHGGDAKLKRHAYTLKLKGSYFADDQVIAHSGSVKMHGPDQSRFEVNSAGKQTVVVVNGNKGWIREGGVTRAMNKAELADGLEDLHTDWVVTLVPLIQKDFTLSLLDPAKIAGRPAVGLRVSHKGRRDVDLYFDRETWLIVKKRMTRTGPNVKDVVYETIFADFKDFDGVKSWTRSTTYRDGKKRIETELTEASFLDKMPASTFEKP